LGFLDDIAKKKNLQGKKGHSSILVAKPLLKRGSRENSKGIPNSCKKMRRKKGKPKKTAEPGEQRKSFCQGMLGKTKSGFKNDTYSSSERELKTVRSCITET